MSLDFLDSLIARELGTASRVRPVPAFYGEALEEQAEHEPEPVPSPASSSRPARRERLAEPSREVPAPPAHDIIAPEPAAPQAAPLGRSSRLPARRAAPPELAAPPPPPPPGREHRADPRPEERLWRPPRISDAPAALEPAAEPETPHPLVDGAEPPAARRPETLRPGARRAHVPAGSVTAAAASPALRPARQRTEPAGDEDAITISIGRIDVRAASPPAPIPSPVPRRPSTSLDAWLAECDATGGG